MARYGICVEDGCPEIVELPARRCPAHPPARSPSSRATSSPGWRATRREVLERDGFRCQLQFDCCQGTAQTVDHVVPASEGGTNDMTNLVAACWPCNRQKGG